MAAKKKKRKRPALEGLTVEEMLKELEETAERMNEIEAAMAKLAPTMDDMREAMEKVRSALDEVGEFDMEAEGDEYVMRLSQNARGKIRFDRGCPRLRAISRSNLCKNYPKS